MSYIVTYTGARVDPLAFKAADINVVDVAHSLSLLNRYTGHTSVPYSVAEHTILLTRHVPEHLWRAAFLHDWSEAYCNDLPNPLKREMPNYVEMERQGQSVIFEAFNEPIEHLDEVSPYDRRICVDEWRVLMPRGSAPSLEQSEPLGISYFPLWDWDEAEKNFLHVYGVLFQ